jgi:hypothetical protein
MLGAVEVKGRPPALVTLHPSDPEMLVAVRKPSRGMKEAFLTDEREAKVIEEVKRMLKRGLPLKSTKPPIPTFKGAKLMRKDDVYYVRLNVSSASSTAGSSTGSSIEEWDEFRSGSVDLPKTKSLDITLENAITTNGKGVMKRDVSLLNDLLKSFDVREIRRAIFYLSSYSGQIELKRIGREGGGSADAVSVEDVGAYQFILKLSVIYPGAIERVKGQALKFDVKMGPLLWKTRDHIAEYLSGEVEGVKPKKWGKTGEKRKRELWEHQRQSLKEMREAHDLGQKGHFIWIPVGMGKTLIVLQYLKWLQKQSKLPKYIIYTLPSSAIESIINEITSFGFDFRLMIPLKNLRKQDRGKDYVIKGCKPKPYTISLIEHDHLRRCEEDMAGYLPDSIFVIDEVHKALNETKRTAVALQFSHLAREFIALTGTPIIDSHTYKLIWWLEQIVPFEVNEKNFWVAANGMVAKKVNTGVLVERNEVVAEFEEDEEEEYAELVPPALGGKNVQPRPEELRRAMDVCYEAATREMVRVVEEYLKRGVGVFVVAKDTKRQQELRDMLVRGSSLRSKDVFLIEKGTSIFLTDEAVEKGKVPDYKVVITTIRKSEGYTLTRLGASVSSVYPSNNATREQLDGRINRIGQRAEKVEYNVVHVGILSYIMERHNDARNLSAVLSALAEDIAM